MTWSAIATDATEHARSKAKTPRRIRLKGRSVKMGSLCVKGKWSDDVNLLRFLTPNKSPCYSAQASASPAAYLFLTLTLGICTHRGGTLDRWSGPLPDCARSD